MNKIKLAFARAIAAKFDKGKWLELGLLTDTEHVIREHPRLLRALSFGDDDYTGAILDVLPEVLGERPKPGGGRTFDHLEVAESFVGLPKWLASNDYDLYVELYGEGTPTAAGADDGTGSTESTSPAADLAGTVAPEPQPATARAAWSTPSSRRKVFLVHGRDLRIRDSLAALLAAFDLRVVDWDEASRATGVATPDTADVITAGMDAADVVVVLFTPDDLGRVQPALLNPNDGRHEAELTGQPRLNVVFEAGMAMARDRSRVVIVEVGSIRPMSDTAGLNVLRMRNDVESRRRLGSRLATAGLEVHMDHDGWRDAGDFTPPAEPAAPSANSAAPVHVSSTESISGSVDSVTLLKAHLPDPTKRIELEELLAATADEVVESTAALPISGVSSTAELEEYLDTVLVRTGPILKLLVAGIRFDRDHEYADLWSGVVRRLLQARKAPTSGVPYDSRFERFRHLPALLALRSAGTVAVHYDYDEALLKMLRDVSWRDWHSGRQLRAAVALHEYKVIEPDDVNALPRWGGTRWVYPTSHFFREVLRDTVRSAIPDDDDYKVASNAYEYRVALIQWHYRDEPGAYRSTPGEFIGEWQWGPDGVPLAETEFKHSLSRPSAAVWRDVYGDDLGSAVESLRADLAQMRRLG